MQEKSQLIVNIPCLGYDTDKKNILMYFLVSTKEFMNLEVANKLVIAAKAISEF